MERFVEVHRLKVVFPQAAPYGFVAEIQDRQGNWHKLAEQIPGMDASQTRELETEAKEGRNVRIRLWPSGEGVVGVSEIQIIGALRAE